MNTVPVILGVDPSWLWLGMGACSLITGEPLSAGGANVAARDGGWLHQQLGRALSDFVAPDWEPVILAVEDPSTASPNRTSIRNYGEVLALIEAEARRRWPHIVTGGNYPGGWRFLPNQWKSTIGLGGGAKAPIYTAWAIQHGFTIPESPTKKKGAVIDGVRFDEDAAAGACISKAAWLANGEAFG